MKNPSASCLEESEEEELKSSSSSEPEDEKVRTYLGMQKARSDGTHIVDRKFNKEKKYGRANKNRWYEIPALNHYRNKQLISEPLKKVDEAILTEHKKKEREAAKQGKKPYYLKKLEIKKQKLTKKYNELKATGKLEAFIDKRRKKNATKDQRYMPYRRPDEERN